MVKRAALTLKVLLATSPNFMNNAIFARPLGIITACALTLALAPVLADDASQANPDAWVPLKLKLPAAVGAGTPKNVPPGSSVELNPKPPPPLLMPRDASNVAPGKKISCSDKNATAGDLDKL